MRRRDKQAAALAEPVALRPDTFRQAAKALGEMAAACSMVADALTSCDTRGVATGLTLLSELSVTLRSTIEAAEREMAAVGRQYLRAGVR